MENNKKTLVSKDKGGAEQRFVMVADNDDGYKVIDTNIVTQKKEIVNLDLKRVSWHEDYTLVTWEMAGGKEKKTATLREFNKEFNEVPFASRPKAKIKVLQVKENLIALINHYEIVIKHNVITGTCELFKDNVIMGTLEDLTQYIWDLCEKQNFQISKERLVSTILLISRENKYNPIQDYLDGCYSIYKGEKVIDELCKTIESTLPQKRIYIKKFLVQMVALAVCDEESTTAGQYLLVLQGKQGTGKTTWFKNLLPAKMQSKYFLGGRSLDPSNKDHIIESVNNWLVEMGEISSTFKKSDQEELKAFITGYKDRLRPPYGKEAIDKKRRTTLCGTTNDTEYLRDETGSRRFLTIPCTLINFEHDIDIDQLWGEVYSLYKEGYKYYFTPQENELVTTANNEFKVKSDIQLTLEQYMDLFPKSEAMKDSPFGGNWATAKEIASHIEDNKPNNELSLSPIVIGKTLKKINVLSKDGNNNSKIYLIEFLSVCN